MTRGGELYLALVLAGFAIFAIMLARQSLLWSRRQAAPAVAPAQAATPLPADGAVHSG